MYSKFSASVLLAILSQCAHAQYYYVVPVDPYRSPGSAIVEGIERGQRMMQRAQEEQDRREQMRLDRELRQAELQQMRDMEQQQRDLEEQRARLEQLRADTESQRAAAREQQSARARGVPIRDDPEGQKWCGEQAGVVSGDGKHCFLPEKQKSGIALEGSRLSAANVLEIQDDAASRDWCVRIREGSVSPDGRHCLIP